MKKFILVIFALIMSVMMAISIASPALACQMGKSPGYWKNHTDAWPEGVNIDDKIGGVFPCVDMADPYYDTTLLEALQTKGNKDGKAAFWRQVVAQYLNAYSCENSVNYLKGLICHVYPDGSTYPLPVDLDYDGNAETMQPPSSLEWWKDYLEDWNSQ